MTKLQVIARHAVLISCVAGFLFFGVSFALVELRPTVVKEGAFDFVSSSIANEVKRRLGRDGSSPEDQATVVSMAFRQMQQQYEWALDNHVERYAAAVLASVCACRSDRPGEWERIARETAAQLPALWTARIAQLDSALERAKGLIQQRSGEYMSRLLGELAVFTNINALLFLICGALAFWARDRAVQLLVPTALLLASTLLCTYWYLFEQDWFHALLFNDYAGQAYGIYVGALFTMLCDVALNKGRILSGLLGAFGVPHC